MSHKLGTATVCVLLLASACGADSSPAVTEAEVPPGPSTTTQLPETMVAEATSTTGATEHDWVPVGGTEYHDSQSNPDPSDGAKGQSARYRALVNDIDEARSRGELHLGTIDRFWADALQLIDERESVVAVNGLLDELGVDRDRLLADLPDYLADHQPLFTAALVERDFDSRVAAYDILAGLVYDGADLGLSANMVHELHFQLGEELQPTLIREAVLASGRTGPKLDPEQLPDLPDEILLVQWIDLHHRADIVVLVDLKGEPIGYLDEHTLSWPRNMTIAEGRVIYGATYDSPGDGSDAECFETATDGEAAYLICDDISSYSNPAWRAEIRIRHSDGSTERVAGAAFTYPEEQPGHPVAGHWVDVMPNSDGSALLAQWSGECESPSAHMIIGGEIHDGFGRTDDGWGPSSSLGWRADGAALVVVSSGACSDEIEANGVFAWWPDGRIDSVYTVTTAGVSVRLVRPYDPAPPMRESDSGSEEADGVN